MTTQPDRPRIHSIITRSRFLHVEDALSIDKVRFFIGQYRRRDQGGQGAEATAYHFLDLADARVVFLDMSWGRELDITDYKGSPGNGQPVSRVLKIKGPKAGKYWLEIHNGPGEVIGQGAVKPAGEPESAISIALEIHEARKLALAIIEYATAYRVAAMITNPLPEGACPEQSRRVDSTPSAAQDLEDLFDPPPAPAPVVTKEPKAAKKKADDGPPSFYALANDAIKAGMLEIVQELIQAQCSWREKTQRLQAAMAS